MKILLLVKPLRLACLLAPALLSAGCREQPEPGEQPSFSGRVESIYYEGADGSIQGFTRFDKGLPGAATMVKEDVWLEVGMDWVTIRLKNRKDYTYILPKQRVRSIVVGTKEMNDLNVPK